MSTYHNSYDVNGIPDDGKPRPRVTKGIEHKIGSAVLFIGCVIIIIMVALVGSGFFEKKPEEIQVQTTTEPVDTTTANTQTPETTAPEATTTETATTTAPEVTTTETATTTGLPVNYTSAISSLFEALGEDYPLLVTDYENWDGNSQIDRVIVATPTTLEELSLLIKESHALGIETRPIGGGHSFSYQLTSGGPNEPTILIQSKELRTNPLITKTENTIRMGAGTTNLELRDYLVDNSLQVAGVPSVFEVTIAGILGTASHSSFLYQGSISDELVSVTMVTPSGKIGVYDKEEDLAAIRCCLGMCGVFYEVELRIQPTNWSQETHYWTPISEVLNDLPNILGNLGDGFVSMHSAPLSSLSDEEWDEYNRTNKIENYNPLNDDIWLRYITPIPKPSQVRRKRDVKESVHRYGRRYKRESDSIETEDQTTTKPLFGSKMAYDWTKFLTTGSNGTEDWLPALVTFYNASAPTNPPFAAFSVVIDDDFSLNNSKRAIEVVLAELKQYVESDPPTMPIQTIFIRWNSVSLSNCTLCPLYVEGNTEGKIAMSMEFVGDADLPEYFKSFINEVFTLLTNEFQNMRVSWPKYYNFIEGHVTQIRNTLGARRDQFVDFVTELDPDHKYMNDFQKEIFLGSS